MGCGIEPFRNMTHIAARLVSPRILLIMKRPGCALITLLLLAGSAVAQQSGLAPPPPPAPAPAMARAMVSYTLESPTRDPARYTLSIDLVGHAVYVAEEALPTADSGSEEVATAPPYRKEFEVSPATRDRVFALAQALDYFHGDFEFRKHRIADTGLRTFRYNDGQRQGETVLHWSENKQIQELTALCEGIASTQTFARRLVYLRRFDKLGMDAVLKRMEEMVKGNQLSELQAIAPVLRQVAGDATPMHVGRER